MSFSKPQLQNPAKKFIEWKSDNGSFSYYDKDTQNNETLPLPVYFVVLDELSTISGFCEKHKSSIYSNEVRSTVRDPLLVKTFKGGERIAGMYDAIKGSIKELGGKYTKSVYAMLIAEGMEPELVNFKFRGAAFSAWLDKKINTTQYVICVNDFHKEKKGATTYNVPVFSPIKITPELTQAAIDMDISLQEYLKDYLAQQIEGSTDAPAEETPAHIAEVDAKLEKIASHTQDNAILDSGWLPKKGAKKTPAQTSNVDDLPF